MSWGTSATSVTSDDAVTILRETFERNYPEPADGVLDAFDAATDAISALLDNMGADELLNVNANGHARQSEDDPAGNFISVSVNEVI